MHPFLIFLLLCIAVIVAVQPLTVLVHELGHAVPALLLTRGKVNVYVGSYGEPAKNIHLRIGRLHLWLRRSLFWMRGLCAYDQGTSFSLRRQYIVVLCGPFASLLVALTAGFVIFNYDFHGALKFLCVMFGVSAIIDLVRNLVPNPEPIRLHDGTVTYNDGALLAHLRYWQRFPDGYMEALGWYNQRAYDKVAARLVEYLERGVQDEQLQRLAVASLISDHRFEPALRYAASFRDLYTPTVVDDSMYAGMLVRNGEPEAGFALFEKLLAADSIDLYTLHNYAYYLSYAGEYEKAFHLLNQVIQNSAGAEDGGVTTAYAYNNRGLCHLMLGRPGEARADILHSRELDPANAYVYRNLGVWHLHAGERGEALALLRKAKEMCPRMDGVDAYLGEAGSVAL